MHLACERCRYLSILTMRASYAAFEIIRERSPSDL